MENPQNNSLGLVENYCTTHASFTIMIFNEKASHSSPATRIFQAIDSIYLKKGYHWTNKNHETALQMSGRYSISRSISRVLIPCWSWKPDPAHTHYWRSDPKSQQTDEYFQDMPAHCPWCPHTWRRKDQHTDDKSLCESETVKLKSKNSSQNKYKFQNK